MNSKGIKPDSGRISDLTGTDSRPAHFKEQSNREAVSILAKGLLPSEIAPKNRKFRRVKAKLAKKHGKQSG